MFPKVFFYRDGGFESVMDMSVEVKFVQIAKTNPCQTSCNACDSVVSWLSSGGGPCQLSRFSICLLCQGGHRDAGNKDGKIKRTARSIMVFIGGISSIIDPDDIKIFQTENG